MKKNQISEIGVLLSRAFEPRHDKTNKMTVRLAKASAQSDQSLRCPYEESLGH